jgi:hypothetical protein
MLRGRDLADQLGEATGPSPRERREPRDGCRWVGSAAARKLECADRGPEGIGAGVGRRRRKAADVPEGAVIDWVDRHLRVVHVQGRFFVGRGSCLEHSNSRQ